MRLATRHRVSLWPVSAGRNYAYGGASPRTPGNLVVDLGGMDRVRSIDEDCGVAVVEPGVTFMAFADQLRSTGSRLMPSVPDIGWGSLIGNALERGFGYTAYGDHSAMLCGLEVVLASGEIVRTGMSALPDCPAGHLYKGGFGPSLDGLFLQSNYGIVTSAGVWLAPRPDKVAVCKLAVDDEAGLGALVDALRPLLLDGTIQSNAVVGNAVIIAATLGHRSDFCTPQQLVGAAETRAMMDRYHLGWWNAGFAVYGAKELVAARLEVIRAKLALLPGARLEVREYEGNVDPAKVHPADRAQLGIPSLDMVRIADWRGGTPAHSDISLVLPPTGREAVAAMTLIKSEVEAAGFDYAGGFTLFPRHAIALALVAFDRGDAVQTRAVRGLFPRVVERAKVRLKTAPYRAHTAFMDLVAAQFDAGDGALRRLVGSIKDAVDPEGILAPGKQGIWPAAKGAQAASSSNGAR